MMTDKELRRARVSQLIAEGRVMNDSLRTRIKKEKVRLTKLEEVADRILAQSNRMSKTPMGTVNIVEKAIVPTANIQLSSRSKFDKLAVIASTVIRDLQSS